MEAILMENDIDDETVPRTGDGGEKTIYTVFSEVLDSPDSGRYTAYGIAVSDEEGKTLRKVHDITCDRAALEELVRLCNELSLSLCHLDDVIEDLLA